MNFALPAVIIFCLVLPGFIVRANIRRTPQLSLDYSPFGKVVASSLIWAATLHFVWIFVTNETTQNRFDIGILLGLLSSEKTLQMDAIKAVSKQPGDIAFYFLSLLAFCILFPRAVRFLVDKYQLDGVHSPCKRLFRFDDAEWYYLFSGADFPKDKQPDYVSISAVAEVGKSAYIYKGALNDYFLDGDGELSRIVLSGASRRKLDNDRTLEEQSDDPPEAPDQERFYEINGDYFVLNYADIRSLNVQYIKIDKGNGSPPASEVT